MARRPTNWGRFFTNLKNSIFVTKQRATLMGTDQFGNKYFEKEPDSSKNLQRRRYIEETTDHDMSHFPEIPVEWEAWLRGRRKNPPSLEEINKNYAKKIKTQMRAAEIDEKHEAQKNPNRKLEQGQAQRPAGIGEDVDSGKQKSEFPQYDEYETVPGKGHKGFREN